MPGKGRGVMSRVKVDWKLSEFGNAGLISTKSVEAKVKVKESDDPIKGNVTVIGRIVNLPEFLPKVEEIINKGKKDGEKTKLTHEYLLADFVNRNILTNFKQYLRVKANPAAAVKAAIARVTKQFPNLPEEQIKAMAEMMLASMKME